MFIVLIKLLLLCDICLWLYSRVLVNTKLALRDPQMNFLSLLSVTTVLACINKHKVSFRRPTDGSFVSALSYATNILLPLSLSWMRPKSAAVEVRLQSSLPLLRQSRNSLGRRKREENCFTATVLLRFEDIASS